MAIRRDIQAALARGRASLPQPDAALAFVLSQCNPDGGFAGRDGASDLYYTSFGLHLLLAFGRPLDVARHRPTLDAVVPANLDLVHLCCWIRCLALLDQLDDARRQQLRRLVAGFRSRDGAFAAQANADHCTAYATFLVLAAWQDLSDGGAGDDLPPDPPAIARALAALQSPEGGYVNEVAVPVASAPATACVMTVLAQMGQPVALAAGEYLRGLFQDGGFAAFVGSPWPDLLTTGTSVFALAQAGEDTSALRPAMREFVHSMNRGGGFCGQLQQTPDVEYTFYALLALGGC